VYGERDNEIQMDTKANVSTVDQKNECDFVWLPSITKFRVKSQV